MLTAWSLNGSYVQGEAGLGPQADVQYPPEIPTALNMKYALVFLFMVELELRVRLRCFVSHTCHMFL